MSLIELILKYRRTLDLALGCDVDSQIEKLGLWLLETWKSDQQIFLCGNGGSAGNAIHIANDFLYGAGRKNGRGLRVEALSSNPAVITCLANDIGYEDIYSEQIRVKGKPGDLLIVFSGSGNSPNIVKALVTANEQNLRTVAITGFSGGAAKEISQLSIHFPIDDMQVSEDMQLIVCHMCMQWLSRQNLG